MGVSGDVIAKDSEAKSIDPRVFAALQRVWGFETLRPLQAEAIEAGLSQQDALVVMPTGGGKSLCYQVPPLVAGRTDVVVSPLIALMKDQVDGLQQLGYPAAALHSNLDSGERQRIERGIRAGEYRLIFVAPERLVTPWFLETVEQLNIHAFAVDEAHCISQWGHDFRPEYRQLAVLRARFPHASIHAYTATATPRVRDDIVHQLQLRDPKVLVGTFDRPNLTYRILPQVNLVEQVTQALREHEREAAIVYCLSRRDTEALAQALRLAGIKAEHYHAGMDARERRLAQERFASEETDVIVATIAFGMGIDRGNVRAVIHACLPKSIENYQQETGRAGRDGLPADCVLFYSQADVMRMERLIQKSADEAADTEAAMANVPVQMALLKGMQKFANAAQCRHKLLSEYFGQGYDPGVDGCGACDVCLGEVEGVEDSTVIAQKILSCVARVQQRFGVGHLVEVLVGAQTQRISELGHDKLSTYGLLGDLPRKTVQSYIYQLLDQDLLARSEGDRPVLLLNQASVEVMRGRQQVRLAQPRSQLAAARRAKMNAEEGDPWEGVHRGLYEQLRELRRSIALDQDVPAYAVLTDRTLLELAKFRPTSEEWLTMIHGIGERKRAAYGQRIVEQIAAYCSQQGVATDVMPEQPTGRRASNSSSTGIPRSNPGRELAWQLFDQGATIDEVIQQTQRALSTVHKYLADWIEAKQPASIEAWVDQELYQRVRSAIRPEDGTLRPIFDRLEGQVGYEVIRLVTAHVRAGQVAGGA